MTTMIKGQASKQPKRFTTSFIYSTKKTNQSLKLSVILDDYAGIKDRALLAPTGALIVIVCYYWSGANFFRF